MGVSNETTAILLPRESSKEEEWDFPGLEIADSDNDERLEELAEDQENRYWSMVVDTSEEVKEVIVPESLEVTRLYQWTASPRLGSSY